MIYITTPGSCGPGIEPQGLVRARQALYQLKHSPSPPPLVSELEAEQILALDFSFSPQLKQNPAPALLGWLMMTFVL